MESRRTSHGLVGRIRPIAAAVVRSGARILVWEDHDPLTGKTVSVPLAGGIEFGETGAQAVTRELKEEINATVLDARYLGLIEDIFTWAGEKRHELYLVYEVELAERQVYEEDEVAVIEPDGTRYLARWRELSEFHHAADLVPKGLLQLLEPTR